MTAPLGRAGFAAALDVSRETTDRLSAYLALLTHWTRRINLVAPSTLADPWRRHILDAAQLAPLIPATARTIADMGAGAGLPGLPLAILGEGRWAVTLIESDQRKAAFLREAARETGAQVAIRTDRLESIRDLDVDIVTARALAPLERLIFLARPMLAKSGCCLFLKGASVESELTDSVRDQIVSLAIHSSMSDAAGRVLSFGLRRPLRGSPA